MNIEFREHQLVVAGLTQQINLLNRRCVEHRKTISSLEEQIAREVQFREQSLKIAKDGLDGCEQRCEALETKIADLEAKRKSRK